MFRKLRRPKRQVLSRPRGGISLGVHYDPDAFGQFSEAMARFLGTGRYLFLQTIFVVVWVSLNIFLIATWRWDKYPFILLNLFFSTQAAYAAPLILLAQNRQAERDREQAEIDRQTSRRTQAEAEFLARELASVRIQLTDAVTHDDLDRAVDRVLAAFDRRVQSLAETTNKGSRTDADDDPSGDHS